MIRATLVLIGIFLFGITILSVTGITVRRNAMPEPAQPKLTACRVLTIYDGDTLGCDLNGDGKIKGQREHVRMLGIDAPEMHYSRKNTTGRDMPYAAEATRLLKQTTQGKLVYMEYDRQRLDKYNRTLAYVYQDKARQRMLNRELVEKGYAKVLFLGKNRRYETDFQTRQSIAQRQNLGIWK